MADKRGLGTMVTDDIEMSSSGFDVFTAPSPENVMKTSKIVEYNVSSTMQDCGPFEFIIPEDGEYWTSLNKTRLYISLKVVKKSTKGDLDATDAVSYCNLFPQSLFKQIEIELNGKQINDLSTPTYALKAYMETMLSYGTDAQKTHLRLSGFNKDEPGKEEDLTGDVLKARTAKLHKNKEMHFCIPIHADFIQNNKYLFPGNSMKFRFIRNSDSYSLISATEIGYIQITRMRLEMHKILLSETFSKSFQSTLLREPSLYPLIQSRMKTILLTRGIEANNYGTVLQGILPTSLTICLLSEGSYNGHIASNPFKFAPYGMVYLNVKKNGAPILSKPLVPSFENDDFCREYNMLFQNIGVHNSNNSIDITPEDFTSNCTFYVYDLSPDKCNNAHIHESVTGSVDIEIGFDKALANNIYMLLYATYRTSVMIDKEKNVLMLD